MLAVYGPSRLPGWLIRFESEVLGTIYGVVFSVVPLLLISICVALLCSNHVTQRFRKDIIPWKSRLSVKDLEVLWREREAKAADEARKTKDAKEALEELELGGARGWGSSRVRTSNVDWVGRREVQEW